MHGPHNVKCTSTYGNTISLYNVYSYMFRHLCVILREFQKCVPREAQIFVIYICALVGWNKNNTTMHDTCIKIIDQSVYEIPPFNRHPYTVQQCCSRLLRSARTSPSNNDVQYILRYMMWWLMRFTEE